jgi:hypothetical protein
LGFGRPRLQACVGHGLTRIAGGSGDHAEIETCTAGDHEWTVYNTTLNRPGGRLSFCSTAVVPVFKAPILGVASLAELAALH